MCTMNSALETIGDSVHHVVAPAAGVAVRAIVAALVSAVVLIPLFAAGSGCGPIERWLERLPGIERVGPACQP